MKLRTKVAIGATAVAVSVLGGGAALAYFTSTGSGTGSGSVGTATAWNVTTGLPVYFPAPPNAITPGHIYPVSSSCLPAAQTTDGTDNTCTSYEKIPYTVKNVGKGNQQLSQVVAAITSTTGTSGTTSDWSITGPNNGCSFADFAIDGVSGGAAQTDTSAAADIAPGGTATGFVTITMVDNASSNQDDCETATVPLNLVAS